MEHLPLVSHTLFSDIQRLLAGLQVLWRKKTIKMRASPWLLVPSTKIYLSMEILTNRRGRLSIGPPLNPVKNLQFVSYMKTFLLGAPTF